MPVCSSFALFTVYFLDQLSELFLFCLFHSVFTREPNITRDKLLGSLHILVVTSVTFQDATQGAD